MLRTAILIAVSLSLGATDADAAACRDAKGKFIKCAGASAGASPAVTKDAKGKCHVASGPKKGAFTKCP